MIAEEEARKMGLLRESAAYPPNLPWRGRTWLEHVASEAAERIACGIHAEVVERKRTGSVSLYSDPGCVITPRDIWGFQAATLHQRRTQEALEREKGASSQPSDDDTKEFDIIL